VVVVVNTGAVAVIITGAGRIASFNGAAGDQANKQHTPAINNFTRNPQASDHALA
tara:strand:+ start:371 stop:535 length:165 start_codon:yes stop_codon:yes gene_type:complete